MSAKDINVQECVRESLLRYFEDLDGETPDGMYDMLVRLVEKPLLEVVMSQADNNQSRAAGIIERPFAALPVFFGGAG